MRSLLPAVHAGEEDVRQEMEPVTFSLGSLLMVFRGLKTRSTRRDLMVLISRPLLVLPRQREAQAPENGTERQQPCRPGRPGELSCQHHPPSTCEDGNRRGTSVAEHSDHPNTAPPTRTASDGKQGNPPFPGICTLPVTLTNPSLWGAVPGLGQAVPGGLRGTGSTRRFASLLQAVCKWGLCRVTTTANRLLPVARNS